MPLRFGLTRTALVEYMNRPRAEEDSAFAKPNHLKFRRLIIGGVDDKNKAAGPPSLSSLACLPLFRSVPTPKRESVQ